MSRCCYYIVMVSLSIIVPLLCCVIIIVFIFLFFICNKNHQENGRVRRRTRGVQTYICLHNNSSQHIWNQFMATMNLIDHISFDHRFYKTMVLNVYQFSDLVYQQSATCLTTIHGFGSSWQTCSFNIFYIEWNFKKILKQKKKGSVSTICVKNHILWLHWAVAGPLKIINIIK